MFWDRFEGLCKENKCRPNNVMQTIGLSAATATKMIKAHDSEKKDK